MTLSSFFFLVCFSLSFFLGIMEKRLPVQDMTIDKGAGVCVVAFGPRDLRLVMKPLVVVFLDYYLVLCWRWGGRAFIDIAASAGGVHWIRRIWARKAGPGRLPLAALRAGGLRFKYQTLSDCSVDSFEGAPNADTRPLVPPCPSP